MRFGHNNRNSSTYTNELFEVCEMFGRVRFLLAYSNSSPQCLSYGIVGAL